MASTLTTFDAVLKEVYLGPIQDQLNSKRTVWGRLTKKDDEFGRYLVIPVRKGRNQGFGAVRPTTGTVPAAGAQQYEDLKVPPKYHYGQIKVRKEVIDQSKTSKAAFGRAVQEEMDNLPIDMANDLNREVLGKGDCNLAPGGVTTFSGTTIVLTNVSDARAFGENMLIDIWDDAGAPTTSTGHTLLYASVLVTAVNVDTGTLTVSGVSLSGTASQIQITRAGARDRDIRHEFLGLNAAIDDADPTLDTSASVTGIQGISRTGNSWFNSKVFGNSGTLRDISDTLLQQTLDAANIRGGGMISMFLTTFGVRDAYEQTQVLLKRYPSTTNLPGGYDEDVDGGDFVKYAGVPIIPDKFAPQNTVLAVDNRLVFIARLSDIDWMDDDGQVLHLAGNNEPAYFANLYMAGELIITKPAGCAKLEDIRGTDAA